MVTLKQAEAAIASLPTKQSLTAVFVGGTSGISEYTVRILAKTYADQDSKLRIYIVGRNSKAAASIIADCRRACPHGEFLFVKAEDLSLLADVDKVCSEITKLEQVRSEDGSKPSIDLLVMSQACTIFQQRKETSEGLDFLMSLMYYSRMRFLVQLLPLLLESSLPARVISIYAAGCEDKLILDDLSLRNPDIYGYFQARSHICYMKTAFLEKLAQQHPGKLTLIHVFPGLILTPAFWDPTNPTWFKILGFLMMPLIKLTALQPDEVGTRMLYLATSRFPARSLSALDARADADSPRGTDGHVGGGAYSVGAKGEVLPPSKSYAALNKNHVVDAAYKHTMVVFEQIAAGRKFTG